MDVHNNIERLKLAIKEELDNHLLESTEALSEIKTETIVSTLENHDTGPEANNPFSNVQLEIKQEVSNHMDVYNDTVSDNQVYKDNIIKEILNNTDFHGNHDESRNDKEIVVKEENQEIEILNNTDFHGNHDESKNDKDMVVKEENHEIPVSFDYPNYDSVSVNSIASLNSVNSNEGCSIDSYEALALGNVEACLQDELNIKFENDTYDDTEKMEYKTEPADTIMCNGVPSTADGLPKDVVVKLPEDKIKEEQILPTCEDNDNNFQLNSITGDLPSFADTNGMDSADSFQLNSITGNVMSLEQEAYSLLKEKKRKVVTSDEGYFACPDCPKIYTNKKGMYRHRAVHKCIERRAKGVARMLKTRKENQKKRAGEVKALNGIDNVSQKLDKNEPPALKKEGYECTCGEVFQRRSRMETCLRSHDFSEQVFRCVTCGSCSKSFKSKEELVSHRKRLHRKRFPCKFCPTDYETRKELFKHLRIHQKVQLMEYKVISEVVKGKQKLKCFMCTKICSELSDLKSHVMNDHKEPYACPHCKNTFGKIIDFANHTKTYHPEVEGQSVLYVLEAFSKLVQAWKCQECGQQFLEADKLAMHQIENHSPEVKATSQFQCEDCRRVFISQKGLMSHRRIHHSVEAPEESKEVEPGVMCLECRKICADMTALTSHVRLHSPDRKYPCKFCDYRFATPEKRKAHADVHTGDMKYVCFICEYQCSSENRLKKHKMSLNHANMREYLLTGKPLIQEPQSSSSRKKESSSKKRKKEDSDDDADDDEESSSSSESEVACDICGEKFPSEKDMLDHKQTHPFIEFPNEDTPTRIFFK